jgi:hypothetical protein
MLRNKSVSFTQPVALDLFGQCLQLSLLYWTVGKAVFHWHPESCTICLNARAVQFLRFRPFVITRFSTIVSTFRDAGWDGWRRRAPNSVVEWAWLFDSVCLQLVDELLLLNSFSVLFKRRCLHLISYFCYWQAAPLNLIFLLLAAPPNLIFLLLAAPPDLTFLLLAAPLNFMFLLLAGSST